MSFCEKYQRIISANFGEKYLEFSDTFEKLADDLIEYNKKVNLTAITDPSEIIAKHFADSLFYEEHIPKNATLLDVGCGGGFPSLVLATVRPDIKITSLDSTAKKLAFVQRESDVFGFNITTVAARAEDFLKKAPNRESFDCVCARAVAPLNILCELCIPAIKISGLFISSKGARAEEEFADAKNALSTLSGSLSYKKEVTLFCENEEQNRTVFVFEKEKKTPIKYPRNFSQITKKPL